MLLFIDNFDSFTYNLVQMFEVQGVETHVVRHNALSVEECLSMNASCVVIGPGPGDPSQSGISKELLAKLAGRVPVLGVCLGHQCLAEVFGGRVIRAQKPMHGKVSQIRHDGKGLFTGVPQGFPATRYHSLIVERASLPKSLQITAESDEGEIMGLRHADYPNLESVQFHPESILTGSGEILIANFLKRTS
ncbi:MAG: aminodeoxychorismate/anthranilate synthase component II [Parachlamydia sp.]|nr:aminodeoxychorismate/anthranilate synthase component II [Parachlamydia sp.]